MMTPRSVATASLSIALLGLLSSITPSLATAVNDHEEFFPHNDEYDHRILDPNTVYGSPYGGFARAARSRLAQLPLILPGVDDEKENDTVQYMTVSDGDGRRFACRTYSEDDISRLSLTDSFLDHVMLKSEQPATTTDDDKDDNEETENAPVTVTPVMPTVQEAQTQKVKMLAAINQLKGVCTQLHKGWWSYEWCFGEQVRQFHIEVDNDDGKAGSSAFKMESITSLGKYQRRAMEPTQQVEANKLRSHAQKLLSPTESDIKKAVIERETLDRMMVPMMGEENPLGIVTDFYLGGGVCPDTKKPRTTEVEYRCCTPQSVVELKPHILLKGMPIPSDIASIVKLDEPSVCNYKVVICTPLLCDGMAEQYEDGPQTAFSDKLKTVTKTWYSNSNRSPASVAASKAAKRAGIPHPSAVAKKRKKDNESIRDIIERTMEGVCLHSNTNEWWAYEFCHGVHVRQYHEGKVLDARSGVTSVQIEAQYLLGKYDADQLESFEREDEIKYVVNVTELEKAMASAVKVPAAKSQQRGSGAYFYQEYTDGQECDGNDPDVGTKGGVPRATTVRFYCGPSLLVSNVNEDATCHYMIDVTIPDLCEHPIFRKPADKKRVIKCLPLADE